MRILLSGLKRSFLRASFGAICNIWVWRQYTYFDHNNFP
ncbi:hypothetical protein ADU37_CDS20490 [Thermococcus sp. 2319x1]|nr:hypothetical protein ADU37_CDS20490 [Thermococcus sp. 2319x1]